MIPSEYRGKLKNIIAEDLEVNPKWRKVGNKRHYFIYEFPMKELVNVSDNDNYCINYSGTTIKRAIVDEGKITFFSYRHDPKFTVDIFQLNTEVVVSIDK